MSTSITLAPFAAPYLALHLALTLNLPRPWRVASCITVSVLSFTAMTLTRTGNGCVDYILGASLVTCVADSISLLLLARPLQSFRHEKDKGPAHELPFIQRYFWVMCMCSSFRGIGWSFRLRTSIVISFAVVRLGSFSTQIKNVPRVTSRSRVSFATWMILRTIFQYTLFEAAYLYTSYNPVFRTSAPITSQGFVHRWLSIVAFVGQTYTAVNFLYFLLASVSVAAGLYEPQSWPDLFGHWRDAYTVRRFWGRTWHQLLRRFLSALGRSPARSAGLAPHTWGSSYVQLYLAFLLSALAHVGGDAMLGISHARFSLPFFLIQPVAITVEDVVISLGRRAGFRQSIWTRLAGYAWVFLWLSVCVPPWLDALVNGVIRTQGGPLVLIGKTLLERVADLAGIDVGSTLSFWFSTV